MEKAETKTTEQVNEELSKAMGGTVKTFHIDLFEPFVKFGKEYLQFFGSKDSFETFCMKLIYHEINRLHWDLTKYVEDNKKKGHILDGQDWFEKHPHLAASGTEDEE